MLSATADIVFTTIAMPVGSGQVAKVWSVATVASARVFAAVQVARVGSWMVWRAGSSSLRRRWFVHEATYAPSLVFGCARGRS